MVKVNAKMLYIFNCFEIAFGIEVLSSVLVYFEDFFNGCVKLLFAMLCIVDACNYFGACFDKHCWYFFLHLNLIVSDVCFH